MKFPEDIPARRIKCPSCGNIFLPDIPKPGPVPSSPSTRQAKPDSRSEPRPPDRDDDRSRRRRDDDEDDNRSRRPRDDEDDDRRSRRRRDDDEDDFRSRRRRDDDDRSPRRARDDDDYDRPSRRKGIQPSVREGQFNRASLAMLLNFIAGWLLVGAIALLAFVWLLHWMGIQEGIRVFIIIAGLLGLGHWLTSATGLGFLVSGPRDRGALGLAIATAAVGGLHLLLMIVIATSGTFGAFGSMSQAHAGSVHWDSFATQLRALPILLFGEIGIGDLYRDVSRGSVVPVIANFVEVARIILYLLTLRAVMLCVRDSKGALLGMRAVMGFGIGAGVLVVFGVLFGLLMLGVRPDGRAGAADRDSVEAVLHLFMLVLYLLAAGLYVGVTLVTWALKGKIDYRA
jgi:hypothetical protein